jgi:hypothetical protein
MFKLDWLITNLPSFHSIQFREAGFKSLHNSTAARLRLDCGCGDIKEHVLLPLFLILIVFPMSRPTYKPTFSLDQTDYRSRESTTKGFDPTLSGVSCLFYPVYVRAFVLTLYTVYQFPRHDVVPIIDDVFDHGITKFTAECDSYNACATISNIGLKHVLPHDAGDQGIVQASGSPDQPAIKEIRPNKFYEAKHRKKKKALENLFHKAVDAAVGSHARRQGPEYIRIATKLIK